MSISNSQIQKHEQLLQKQLVLVNTFKQYRDHRHKIFKINKFFTNKSI